MATAPRWLGSAIPGFTPRPASRRRCCWLATVWTPGVPARRSAGWTASAGPPRRHGTSRKAHFCVRRVGFWRTMNRRSRETLTRLAQRAPGARFRLGGRELVVSGDSKDMLAWLKQRYRAEPSGRQRSEDCWTVFRGDAARNGESVWSGSLGDPRWYVKTVESEPEFSLVQSLAQHPDSQGNLYLPVLHPIVAGDTVLARTPWRLLGLDFETGKIIWEYPWQTSRAESAQGANRARAFAVPELRERVFENASYGQLSSDGRRVFFVDPPEARPVSNYGPPGGALAARFGPPNLPNRLVALDLAGEGRLAWSIGGESGEEESKLAGAYFLGAPLPDGGRLYVMAEVRGEILLCALDARGGRLEWSRVIAHPRDSVHHDDDRRLAGASPSLADGVIVCPTSAGVVVAVNAATRSILWGFPYRRIGPLPPSRGFAVGPAYTSTPVPESNWIDGTAVLGDGRVLVTPFDSDQLYCLDLVTGEEIWSYDGADMLFLACVHKDLAVLVGPHELTALRTKNHKPAWQPGSTSIPDDARPSGRGLFTASSYYLPTTAKQILQIDLETGRIVARIPCQEIPGNVIAVRSRLISQGADRIEQFAPNR